MLVWLVSAAPPSAATVMDICVSATRTRLKTLRKRSPGYESCPSAGLLQRFGRGGSSDPPDQREAKPFVFFKSVLDAPGRECGKDITHFHCHETAQNERAAARDEILDRERRRHQQSSRQVCDHDVR